MDGVVGCLPYIVFVGQGNSHMVFLLQRKRVSRHQNKSGVVVLSGGERGVKT